MRCVSAALTLAIAVACGIPARAQGATERARASVGSSACAHIIAAGSS